MDCELCGNTNANTTADIEGVRMRVCTACAPHGKVVQRVPQERQRFVQQEETELIETVRPETPKLLRTYRESTGMSLHDFAQKLNMKASVYQHFESGSRLPSIDTARMLERVCSVALVIKMKIKKGSYGKSDAPGMTFSDFLKK